ncbi:MAG TPA: hypothetical protein VGJ09_09435 [Bryobacteraceae bacterium]
MRRILSILAIGAALAWGQDKQPEQVKNIELTVYLLSGVAQGDAADDVPQDLVSTVKQLRSIFNYKSYRLTESFMLRGRLGGGARAEGVLPGDAGLKYEFRYGTVTASGETAPLFRINGLRIVLTKPRRVSGGQINMDTVASIQTDLDIREGQKTVVGKSSVSSGGDALILVIVPKIVE